MLEMEINTNDDNLDVNIESQDEALEANIEVNTTLGTDNYKELKNKPSINGVELIDNKSLDELGIQPAGNYSTYEYVDGRFDTVNTEINNINIDLDNTNSILNNKANISYVEEKLNLKADKVDLDTKANISDIPTRVSQLVNDEGYLTEHQDISNKADIDYVEELLDRKSDKSDTYTKVDVNSLLDEKQDVLIAGDNISIDESNTISAMVPSIVGLATKQELQQGLNTKQDKGDYATNSRVNEVEGLIPDISNLATKEELQDGLDTKQPTGDYALKSEIPTKVSSFTNDANYQTYTDVASMIASIPQFSISIVDSLPSSGQKMVLYLVPKTSASGDDIYDEYIWIESTSAFELVGSTTVDLGDYYTKTETNTLLSGKQDKGNYAKTDEANTFTQGQVITTNTSGAILKLSSPAKSTNFILERVNGSQCVLESGETIGLFGTITEHPLQIRTNYINRMTVGTDGSVVLQHDVSSYSNSNQVATTKWTNRKLSAKLTGVSLTEDEYNALATKDTNTLYLIEE